MTGLVTARRTAAPGSRCDVSDIARVYAAGLEPAKGGQTGGQPEVSGKEKATIKNADSSHDYKDDRTR